MALPQERTAPDSTTKPPIHEVSAHYPRNSPRFRAFAVIERTADHGRIPLRPDSAASFPKQINCPKFIEKPREFIEIYLIVRKLLFALFRLRASPERLPRFSTLSTRVRHLKNRGPHGRPLQHTTSTREPGDGNCGEMRVDHYRRRQVNPDPPGVVEKAPSMRKNHRHSGLEPESILRFLPFVFGI